MKRPQFRVALAAFVISIGWAQVRAAMASIETPAVVFVDEVKPQALFETLSYPARVVPKFNTTILAESDGIVSRIYAPLGQRVGRRQKVLAITHTDPVYQYAPVTMLSPVAGIVSAIEVTEGSQVTKGQRLGSVTDPSQVRVTVELPAQDLPFLKAGMVGEFRFTGREDKIALKVRGISPFVDPATGTASCELELVNAQGVALAPGQLGQVSFKANLHQGISIPDYAVVYHGADTLVRVIEDGNKAKQVPVKLGRKERGNVEILSGLKTDFKTVVQLVLRTSRYIADGEAVTVQANKAVKDGIPQ